MVQVVQLSEGERESRVQLLLHLERPARQPDRAFFMELGQQFVQIKTMP